jgi:hypothetical protein
MGMKINDFAKQHLNLTNIESLEVYNGYLIAGQYKKRPRCIWINKQNIEGLTEVVKVLAIETAFKGILSLIPGGSFAYQLIRDQIGYPPRHNVIFDPEMYTITFSLVTLDQKGEKQTVIDSFTQNIDNVTKVAFKTGEKLHESLIGLISKDKNREKPRQISNDEIPLGFTYIRFIDKISQVRDEIISQKIEKTASRTGKVAKTLGSELAPSIIISFKTTANEEAKVFLKYLEALGFSVRFSQSVNNEEGD